MSPPRLGSSPQKDYSYLVRQKETWRLQNGSRFPLLPELLTHVPLLCSTTPECQPANFLLTNPSQPVTISSWLVVAVLRPRQSDCKTPNTCSRSSCCQAQLGYQAVGRDLLRFSKKKHKVYDLKAWIDGSFLAQFHSLISLPLEKLPLHTQAVWASHKTL